MAVLTGCSLTTPRDVGNGHRVFLKPVAEKMVCRKGRMGSLVVAYPKVPDTLDTSRIALVDQTGRWDYFSGMRWADFLPGNVQSALIESLSASGKFSSVSSDDTVELGRLTLGSEINKFEAVYHTGATAPDVEVDVAFTLHEGDSPRIRKQFIASSKVHAAADNADAIGAAFGEAFTEVQRTAVSKITCR